MGNGGEKGWNIKFDEGVRLIAKKDHYLGITAELTLPTDYETIAAKDSYFTFYLGISETTNPNHGRQIEAGISYSIKGWNFYLNGDLQEKGHLLSAAPSGVCNFKLMIDKGNVTLTGAGNTLTAPTLLKKGAPKMIIAIGEAHTKLTDRKVWFNQASWRAIYLAQTKVKDPFLNPASTVAKAFNGQNLNLKLFSPVISDHSIRVSMPARK